MPKDLTQKRIRRALRKLSTRSSDPGRRRSPTSRWPIQAHELGPSRIERDREEGPDDELDGGSGVREPRSPRPTMPAAALSLDPPEPEYLDLTR